MSMKAPFPWFGGKRRVAHHVWDALGDVDNYVEPFAGSLAVLLERPHTKQRLRAETVNDADHYLANFWRALIHDPDAVLDQCDWPVNESDLFARHAWLVNTGRDRIASMEADPDFYDAKVAGWWLWGINSWIGSGWCSGNGPHRPHLGNGHWQSERKATREALSSYLHDLHDRLRRVRVCCGDWSRVVTRGALAYGASVGVFLDPPYLGDVRTADLYSTDDHTIAHQVREWALANGDDPRLRIVLAGYGPEHDHLMPDTWRRVRWSASVAYQTTSSATTAGGNQDNRHQEVLWLSPHCLNNTPSLFDEVAP